MRKKIFGRRLKRTTNQRKALFRSLTNALVLHGKIKTTEAKAKAVKGEIEKLITHAKKDANPMQYLQKHVHMPTAKRLVENVAPVFKDRNGGYLRIVKIGTRKKDNAPMVLLEFVDKVEAFVEEKKREKKAQAPKQTKEATVKTKKAKAPKTKKKEAKSK